MTPAGAHSKSVHAFAIAMLLLTAGFLAAPGSAPALGPVEVGMVKDIFGGEGEGGPRELTDFEGTLYLTAYDGTHGGELWRSDGTEAGTELVKDIRPGAFGSQPEGLTNVDGTLYFSADDGTHGGELWRSDGTEAGTTMVADIWGGAEGSRPKELTNVDGTLYFAAYDGTHGGELWRSDGTEAGTTMVADIWGGAEESRPEELTNVAGTLYFSAADGTHGRELWCSHGTEAGTTMVKDIWEAGEGSRPKELTNVAGTLYFSADEGPVFSRELWRSDGTEDGTSVVKEIRPRDQGGSYPQGLTNVGGTLYFSADDGVHGYELWRSDGTQAGTVPVKDVLSEGDLVNVDGTVFFSANGIEGYELWRSDGTEGGTTMVRDIRQGHANSYPASLANYDGVAYFSANDGTHGRELWRSDGTEAGTTMVADIRTDTTTVKDIRTGTESSFPNGSSLTSLTKVNGTLYFRANDGVHGVELWRAVETTMPTLTASASPWVYRGGAIDDGATLSGLHSMDGQITFELFGPEDEDCSGAPVYTDTVAVGGNGDYRAAEFVPESAGTYRWLAAYSGGAHSEPVSSDCGDPGQSVSIVGPVDASPGEGDGEDTTSPASEWQGKAGSKGNLARRARALARCRKAFRRNHNAEALRHCRKRARGLHR